MHKSNIRKAFGSLLIKLLLCILTFGIIYLIAILITSIFDVTVKEVMIVEGLVTAFFGVLLSPNGNSGINLRGMGQRNANIISYEDAEISRLQQQQEREDKDYYRNFFAKSAKGIFKNNLIFAIVGIATFLFAVNFL